jgi:uncharacterized membrane protein
MPSSADKQDQPYPATQESESLELTEQGRRANTLPSPNIIQIYESLSPESADRILKMVEREQRYEEESARTEFRLASFRFALLAVLVLSLLGFVFYVGITHPKFSSGSWLSGLTGVAAGSGVSLAAMRAFENWQDFREAGRKVTEFHRKHDL